MDVKLRRYFWLFPLGVIAVCSYFAASCASSLIAGNLPVPRRRMAASSVAPGAEPAFGPKMRDLTEVASRNVFCSTCEKQTETPDTASTEGGDTPAPSGDGEPTRSSLKLKLLATLISDKDKAWSYAALKDTEADKTRMYPIGAKIADSEATVVDILERRVLLQNGGRLEYIPLELPGQESASPEQTPAPQPRPTRHRRVSSALSKFTKSVKSGIRKTGPNKWEIDRSALNRVLGNTTMLARSARIVPSVRNGKPNGFKLYAIRPGTVYSLIGMKNGDTIHAINGHSITTPDKALEVYTQVRNASHLTISFSRRGKSKTHDYTIR